ncbi:MAG: hypothetical protein KF694_01790 [Mesorhizobium sp.]|nr:hypothetical protein [Mesorhizobium sp.]
MPSTPPCFTLNKRETVVGRNQANIMPVEQVSGEPKTGDQRAAFAHNIVLISPLPSEEDQLSAKMLLAVPVSLRDGRKMSVSVLGTPNRIAGIGCTLPDIRVTPEKGPCFTTIESGWINRGSDHMLSVLRMTFDPNIDYLRFPQGIMSFSYFDEKDTAEFKMRLAFKGSGPQINPSLVESTFRLTANGPLETILALLAEGMSERIPEHYRFLSLYKVIELENPTTSAAFHDRLQPVVNAMGTTSKLARNLLPALRVRVAHALAKGAEAPGLTAQDRDCIHTLIPAMINAIFDDLGPAHGVKIQRSAPGA